MNLYNEIRKIQIEDEEIAQHFTKEAYAGYKVGKREMRESAAELSLKAEARIEELEEMLKWYIDTDEIHEGDPENQYWIEGKHKAMKLLGMEVEE